MVGLKLHYTPKQLHFDPEFLDVNKVDLLACGRKHFIITTTDNNVMAWGNVFKEKDQDEYSEGFFRYNGALLFEEGKIKELEVKYSIFGALVEH